MKSPQAPPLYNFPPGLRHNLVWYIFGKFRPGDPISLFQYLAREYGDIAHYKIGPHHIIFLNDPEYIREVLVVQNSNFVKERTVQRTKLLLGEGMITSEGVQHRTQRQAAQPAFHRQRVASYGATMVAESIALQNSWRNGQALNVSEEMMGLTLRIVAKTLFNTELGSEVRELTGAINNIMRLYNYLIVMPAVDVLIRLRVPGLYAFTKAKVKLDAVVHRMIEEHRRNGPQNNDLLDMMLDAETTDQANESLRDQVLTMFLAGYETVGNALIWTWYLLSQNPEVEEKFHAAIDRALCGRTPTIDDLPSLSYVEAVLAESMRLFPPAWAMGRCALKDFALGEYRFPAGTTVLCSQFVTQRDPRYFHDPLRFDPDRFSGKGRNAFPKFVYFPFGGGARQCVGEAFAWVEGVLVLAALGQRWRFRLDPSQRIEVQPLITLRPRHGMLMHLEQRRPANLMTPAYV